MRKAWNYLKSPRRVGKEAHEVIFEEEGIH